jgi:hypothetical protein
LTNDEYQCAICKEIFNKVRNEEWSEEKAHEEYEKNFPGMSKENMDVVCDDCFKTLEFNISRN